MDRRGIRVVGLLVSLFMAQVVLQYCEQAWTMPEVADPLIHCVWMYIAHAPLCVCAHPNNPPLSPPAPRRRGGR